MDDIRAAGRRNICCRPGAIRIAHIRQSFFVGRIICEVGVRAVGGDDGELPARLNKRYARFRVEERVYGSTGKHQAIRNMEYALFCVLNSPSMQGNVHCVAVHDLNELAGSVGTRDVPVDFGKEDAGRRGCRRWRG